MPTSEQTKLLLLRKIKSLRESMGWKPKQMAHHLNMSPGGYRDIERGETDIPLSRLLQIAEVLEVKPAELFNSNDKNIFQVGNNRLENHSQINYCKLEDSSQINSCPLPTLVLQQELEKAQLVVEHLKQQNADLRVMIELYQKARE